MSACIISFSGRRNGNCSQIAQYLQTLHGDAVVYDFADFSIQPCGRCDYECMRAGAECPKVGDMENALLDAIVSSERTYFILPNYSDFPCANFFIFNERSIHFFWGSEERLNAYESVPKKAVVVSGSGVENFVTALSYHGVTEKDILCLSAKSYGKKSIDGDILSSPEAKTDIAAFADL